MLGLGVGIGLLSGFFGVGGSSIATPMLRILLDVPRLQAIASPLPVTLPAALAGTLANRRRGLTNRRATQIAVVWGIPGVIAGAISTRWLPTDPLIVLTAIIMILISGRLLVADRLPRTASVRSGWPALSARTLGPAAVVIGVLSGMLANGGGILLVPAFIFLGGATAQEAAATSLVCVAFYAVPGIVVHASLGHIDYLLSGALSAGTLPATYVSARLSVGVRSSRVRSGFAVLLTTLATIFLAREFG